MASEDSANHSGEILRVVNAAASPADLAAALAGSSDATAGLVAARALLARREAKGVYRELSEVSAVVDQHGPLRVRLHWQLQI